MVPTAVRGISTITLTTIGTVDEAQEEEKRRENLHVWERERRVLSRVKVRVRVWVRVRVRRVRPMARVRVRASVDA